MKKAMRVVLWTVIGLMIGFWPAMPGGASAAGMESGRLHFFTFNKANLKDNMKQQERGMEAVRRISLAAKGIPGFQVNAIQEPALRYEDYIKNPVEMKVSRQIILQELGRYAKELENQDTLIIYSHTHGVKNGFKEGEPWGGIRLDIRGDTLPHQGVTIWSDYADALLAIPAKNVVVLLMCCFSGGFVDYLKEIEDRWKTRAETGRNFLVITSQNRDLTSDPVLIEGELYNPFTSAVERALKGKADGYIAGKPDGAVTLEELVSFVMDTTRKLSDRAFPQSIGSYDKGEVLFSLNPAIPYPSLIPAPNDHPLSSGGFGRR